MSFRSSFRLVNQNANYCALDDASMLANPDIEMVASAKNHIGRGDYGLTLKNQDQELEANMLDVGIDYLETMGLKIIEGRSFSKELETSDKSKAPWGTCIYWFNIWPCREYTLLRGTNSNR